MLDIIARVTLFPILAAQGLYVYRRALVLPDASGDVVGQSGDGPKLRLLIVGDSSAAGVGTSHHEEALLGHMRKRLCQTDAVDWHVCAQSGATTQVMLERLRAMPAQKFDVVSISLGVNEITKLVSCRTWCRLYRALIELVEAKFGAQLICVPGVPKMQYFPLLPQPLRGVLGLQAARYDRALQAITSEVAKCTKRSATMCAGLDVKIAQGAAQACARDLIRSESSEVSEPPKREKPHARHVAFPAI